ncbi:MAG: tetratricopeptide repeat protein [Pseudomonadota bacterium]
MSESESFFKQLMHRRVPQIVGAYIATLWLAVEIGGWVTAQLGVPETYSLYLFVLLFALLPSVVVLAWRHGAPGPDTWGRTEKLVVPTNALLAIALVAMVVQFRPPMVEPEVVFMEAAVIERTLIDEDGQEQVFQVAREGFGVYVLTLYWPNEDESVTEVSWESYAAPWLVGVDLNQDPLINGGVIQDRLVIERLLAAGYEEGVGEPLSLGLNIAEDGGADYLLRGSYRRTPTGYSLRADLYATVDGALIDSFVQDGDTLIAASDELSRRIGERLVGDLDRGDAEFRPLGLAEMTTTDETVLEPFIAGVNSLLFDADYPAGIASLEAAVEQDSSFSHGWAWLQQAHRFSGDMASANAAIEQALLNDYKLETEMRFILKANQYAVLSDVDRAVRVIRMWTEVQPFNLRAWTTLTSNLMLVGEIDEARESNNKAREIDPDRASLNRTGADIEEMSGNFELAAALMRSYLEAEPDDDAAWISLGGTLERSGDIAGAEEAYERASFVASSDFNARERLVRLEARTGNPERALREMDRILASPLQPTEQARLAREKVSLLGNLGRIEELLSVIDEYEFQIGQALPPVMRTLTIEAMRIDAYASLGQIDQAMALSDEIEAQMPEPFKAFASLARGAVYEQVGDVSRASTNLQVLEDSVALFQTPGMDVQLENERARVLALDGDLEGAVERVTASEAMLDGSMFVLMSDITEPMSLQKAGYQFKAGQFTEARETLTRLLGVYPNFGEAKLLQARVLNAMGESETARALLDGLLGLWGSADADYQPRIEAQALAAAWGVSG